MMQGFGAIIDSCIPAETRVTGAVAGAHHHRVVRKHDRWQRNAPRRHPPGCQWEDGRGACCVQLTHVLTCLPRQTCAVSSRERLVVHCGRAASSLHGRGGAPNLAHLLRYGPVYHPLPHPAAAPLLTGTGRPAGEQPEHGGAPGLAQSLWHGPLYQPLSTFQSCASLDGDWSACR